MSVCPENPVNRLIKSLATLAHKLPFPIHDLIARVQPKFIVAESDVTIRFTIADVYFEKLCNIIYNTNLEEKSD